MYLVFLHILLILQECKKAWVARLASRKESLDRKSCSFIVRILIKIVYTAISHDIKKKFQKQLKKLCRLTLKNKFFDPSIIVIIMNIQLI